MKHERYLLYQGIVTKENAGGRAREAHIGQGSWTWPERPLKGFKVRSDNKPNILKRFLCLDYEKWIRIVRRHVQIDTKNVVGKLGISLKDKVTLTRMIIIVM